MKLADAHVMSLPKKLVEARLLGLESQLNRIWSSSSRSSFSRNCVGIPAGR
jgi:hypothetical protein